MAARLAIARAQRQLAVEAGVNLHTRNFHVINQVFLKLNNPNTRSRPRLVSAVAGGCSVAEGHLEL